MHALIAGHAQQLPRALEAPPLVLLLLLLLQAQLRAAAVLLAAPAELPGAPAGRRRVQHGR